MSGRIPKQHQAFRWLIVVVLAIVLLASVVGGIGVLVSTFTDG